VPQPLPKTPPQPPLCSRCRHSSVTTVITFDPYIPRP